VQRAGSLPVAFLPGALRPLLEIMGQIAKICNNMLAAILMTGTSEALNLAQRHVFIARCFYIKPRFRIASSPDGWSLKNAKLRVITNSCQRK